MRSLAKTAKRRTKVRARPFNERKAATQALERYATAQQVLAHVNSAVRTIEDFAYADGRAGNEAICCCEFGSRLGEIEDKLQSMASDLECLTEELRAYFLDDIGNDHA